MKRLLVLLAGCTSGAIAPDAEPGTDPCAVVLPTYGAATATEQHAEAQDDYVGLVGVIDTDPGENPIPEVFSLELYGGATMGSHTIEGVQTQYATCSVCAVLYADYEDGHAHAGMYLATAGEVTLDDVSGRLTGTVSDLVFAHVSLDDDLTSAAHMDQCVTAMTSLTFDAEITR